MPATNITPPAFANPAAGPGMAAPSRDPFGSPTAPAIPAAGPGANTPFGSSIYSALGGFENPWTHLLGT
jgi:hypothetical protein